MQREVNNELSKATEGATASAIELRAYAAIVNDTTQSENKRQGALVELKKAGIAVDDVNISTARGLKTLNSRVERSIELSIQKAIVDKAAAKIAELELSKIEAVKQAQEGVIATIVDEVAFMGLKVQRLKEGNKALDEADAQINLYKNALSSASSQVANLSKGVENDTEAQKLHNSALKAGTTEAEKEAEAFRKLEDAISNPKNTGKSLLAPVDPVVTQSMDEVLQKMDEIPAAVEGVKTPPLFTDVVEEAPAVIGTTVEISDAFKEMADRNSESFQKNASALNASNIKTAEWAAKTQINAAFANLQMQTAENIGQFIADMATGDAAAGKNFGKNMLGAIAAFMDTLGKAIVTTAIATEAFEKLIVANPAAAAVAGLAMITGAAIVRNELKKGPNIQAFADGGIVSGPTLGLMGEYPNAASNPEVIAPLDKLQSMIGGGKEGYIASTQIQGRDLAIVLERYNKDTKRG
jgi:FtsZ-binding cell division protein ZapB